MKWEYKTEGVNTGRYYDSFFELILKPSGEKGWECIHITERKNSYGDDEVHLKGYFKRRLNDSEDGPAPS